ncbi:hypothetical protein TNCV_364071 [Trichonephila clavipes]|uniref:Uncharacterized protein n=1 Tax=Trichonephila clavipes TaxID=2585209 RepID=A0A8X6VNE0_TRICX|nr:hypothetical protein TNCV_364071 [Trichonephila clavipes]
MLRRLCHPDILGYLRGSPFCKGWIRWSWDRLFKTRNRREMSLFHKHNLPLRPEPNTDRSHHCRCWLRSWSLVTSVVGSQVQILMPLKAARRVEELKSSRWCDVEV